MAALADLQGRWKVVSLAVAGNALPPATFASAEVVVTGDKFESLGMGAVYTGRIELHADTFAFIFREGPEAGNRNNGRYAFDGARWTICLDMKGGPAPAAMASTPANGYALQTLERIS